jgi:hypothetical protein
VGAAAIWRQQTGYGFDKPGGQMDRFERLFGRNSRVAGSVIGDGFEL